MIKNPLVSIICLCYNHEAYVIESLQSVIEQTYKNIEIIIVDDASIDDSVNKINAWRKKHFDNIKFIANKKNLGNTTSFNKALKLAKGDYIFDLATDDVLLPECLSLLVNKFKTSTYTNLGVVFANVAMINCQGDVLSYFYEYNDADFFTKKPPTGDIFIDLLSYNVVAPTSMLVKKKVFEKLKGYNSNLMYEDLDFWFRSSSYFQYDYLDAVVMHKRELETSLGNQYKKVSTQAKKINLSTYKTISETIHSNLNKNELKAILKRVNYEFALSLKTYHLILAFKYIWEKIYIHYKILIM